MDKFFGSADITLFLTYFIPGFIALKVHDLLVPTEQRDFSKSIFDAVAYSAILFVLLFPLTRLILSEHFHSEHPASWITIWFVVFLMLPALVPIGLSGLLTSRLLTRWLPHPEPRAWDFVFSKREACWVTVHLRDMRRIGGRFDNKSFASSHPSAEPQIYLEEVWNLSESGAFLEKVSQSNGILIRGSEILAIQFFRYTENHG
jgi:hypothetical protein